MPKEAPGAVEGSSLIWRRSRQEEIDETGGDASERRGREVKPIK
jgi:hypothetical protein